MMKNQYTVSSLVGLLLIVAMPAHAQYSGYYLEGAGGPVDASYQVLAFNFTESSAGDSSARLTVGFKFNDNISVEASYTDYGDFSTGIRGQFPIFDPSDMSVSIAELPVENQFSITSFGLGVVGGLPLGRYFEVYGKASLHQWDLDTEFTNIDNDIRLVGEDDGSGLAFGAGVAFNPNLNFSIRLEYEYNDLSSGVFTDEFEIKGSTLGIRYYF